MITGFLTIGILQTLAVISPGPDFAVIVKNTLGVSRRAGFFTALGITSGILFHMTYCLLGLGLIIREYPLLFDIIKYLGCGYLIYIGFKSLFFPPISHHTDSKKIQQDFSLSHFYISHVEAFRQGLLCNILNPKAVLFFLGLFTLVINPLTPKYIQVIYALEIMLITFILFFSVSFFLSHKHIMPKIARFQGILSKLMGLFLIFFGARLALMSF